MSLDGISASPVCVPGSGASAPLSGIFLSAVKHRASHDAERPRLIRADCAKRRFVAMAGDAEGWVARVRGQMLPRTAGRN